MSKEHITGFRNGCVYVGVYGVEIDGVLVADGMSLLEAVDYATDNMKDGLHSYRVVQTGEKIMYEVEE